jgi:hypothetical protein
MPKTLTTKVITVEGNLREACRQFNAHQFFECHETFEEIWQEEQSDVRDLYKGLIQVAAGYVHITRGNYIGADRLLRTALGYLAPYRAEGAMGFDIDTICRAAERQHAELVANGPGQVVFDPALVPIYTVDTSVLSDEARRWRAWGFDRDGTPLEMTITVID